MIETAKQVCACAQVFYNGQAISVIWFPSGFPIPKESEFLRLMWNGKEDYYIVTAVLWEFEKFGEIRIILLVRMATPNAAEILTARNVGL